MTPKVYTVLEAIGERVNHDVLTKDDFMLVLSLLEILFHEIDISVLPLVEIEKMSLAIEQTLPQEETAPIVFVSAGEVREHKPADEVGKELV